MTPKSINDPLTYLTAHVLSAIIEHHRRAVFIEKDDETLSDFGAISYDHIASMAVGIAKSTLDKINRIKQETLDSSWKGEFNGWSWEIHPWDSIFLDNIIDPDTKWYVNIRGKKQWFTADGFECLEEARSSIVVFCKFHHQGEINPNHPIDPFKAN